jgi:hypothetical protein
MRWTTLLAAAITAGAATALQAAERVTRPEPDGSCYDDRPLRLVPHVPDPDRPETCWRNVDTGYGTRTCPNLAGPAGLCDLHATQMREWNLP